MLAQLVEQRTFNPFVVGSTPAHPTKYALGQRKPDCLCDQAFLFCRRWSESLIGALAPMSDSDYWITTEAPSPRAAIDPIT